MSEKKLAILIDKDWRLKDFAVGEARPLEIAAHGLDDRFWMAVSVPGDVFATLARHKIIEHPFLGHNDQKSRWVEEREWWYRNAFELSREDLDSHPTPDSRIGDAPPRRKWELIFEGIDTFATVFVNGLEVGRSENMFRAAVFDLSSILRPGKNVIAVKIDPVSLFNKDKLLFEWSSYTKDRPWIRKAAMHFGWDWGPRIVTMGIWGAVRLERNDNAKIRGVYCRTELIGPGATPWAQLKIDTDVETFALPQRGVPGPMAQFEALLRLVDAEGKEAALSTVALTEKTGAGYRGSAVLELDAARLWWAHDFGEPYLYRLETVLLMDGTEVDRREEEVGVRTLELSLEREGQPDFCFVLNGLRLFAKGANWIPVEHFFGAANDDRYSQLLEMSRDAGMNMLRVWAGGIYEKDFFYRECDRLGILVWQDCTFANALFPDFNRDFVESVRGEIEHNVTRLRNHAALALWCGNNEIDWLYDMKTAAGEISGAFFGRTIYHDLIPRLLTNLDPARPYWPSSPWGRQGDQDVNDPATGDRHNWQVWHGSVYPRKFGEAPVLDYSVDGVSFKSYAKDFTLFSSEFGMHAAANRYTLQKWIPPDEFYWGSAEMAYRNKDANHRKGLLLMEGFCGVPKNIDEYLSFSMLTQAEGLKFGIEHYRRNRLGGAAGNPGISNGTNGALIWQLNDSWPGTSWSLIDYELLPKASYYYAKRFFAPLMLSLTPAGTGLTAPGKFELWCVNDRPFVQRGTATVEIADFSGKPLIRERLEVEVAAGSAVVAGRLSVSEFDPADVYVRLRFTPAAKDYPHAVGQDDDSYESINYLCDHKDLRLPPTLLEFSVDPKACTVTIAARGNLARLVCLDFEGAGFRLSDNYFDLEAGESKTVHIDLPGRSSNANPVENQIDLNALTAGLRVRAINSERSSR